ncbi:hypothetical protein JZU46_02455 [bacterium]|nr:hypothetical protein [bacterium]
MQITSIQSLAVLVLGLALFRSSKILQTLLQHLHLAKGNSQLHRSAYVLCTAIASLPEFFSSSKAIDLIVAIAKA